MIISVTFSKPVKNCAEIIGKPYTRIKIRAAHNANGTSYSAEYFTDTQVFHSQQTEEELISFIKKHAGTTFKNCIIRSEAEETTILANKKGKITTLTKKITGQEKPSPQTQNAADGRSTTLRLLAKNTDRTKNYILSEGIPVPFLVLLGIMTPEGKVISAKYNKFRQINRFLEYIRDILPDVKKRAENRAVRIVDFGCGKSYLTFAVHYFLTEINHLEADIIGLDLKQDVIDWCRKITARLGLRGLHFDTGNIADYSYAHEPDIVMTLHACDTATDYALDYAVQHNACAILSVPCCQHELNAQLDDNLKKWRTDKNLPEDFEPLLKYGLIKERFSALVTDALRAEYLERRNYTVHILEFIDAESTPKNLLIRAVKKNTVPEKSASDQKDTPPICRTLNLRQKLWNTEQQ